MRGLGPENQYWPTQLKPKIGLSSQSQPIRWKWTSNPVKVSPARQYMYWDLEIIIRENPKCSAHYRLMKWWEIDEEMIKLKLVARVVSAFVEPATKQYLASRTSFKRILRRHNGFLGFWQKWKSMKIGETTIIRTPLKRDYIRRGKADK